MVTQAMLMAAGLGTRLRPFTQQVAKPLLPVLGVPMAQFALDALGAAGVTNVVANVHHLAAPTRAALARLERPAGMRLTVSDESAQLLGSAGGLRQAAPHFGRAPFFLVNGDTLCDIDLGALARTHARLRRQWDVWVTLTVFPAGAAGGGKYSEIFIDPARGRVNGVGDPARGRPYFVGCAVVEPAALAGVPADGPAEFVASILLPAIAAGRAGLHLAAGAWHDVGSPELWHGTQLALLRGLETGALSPRWRARLEGANIRVADGIWRSRRSPARVDTSRWAAPAYWDAGDPAAAAPRELGPGAFAYGGAGAEPLAEGVAFGGMRWEKSG